MISLRIGYLNDAPDDFVQGVLVEIPHKPTFLSFNDCPNWLPVEVKLLTLRCISRYTRPVSAASLRLTPHRDYHRLREKRHIRYDRS